MSLTDRAVNLGLDFGMATLGRGAYDRLLGQAGDPEAAQRQTLQRILRALATTAFGRSLGLGAINDPEGFRSQVPIHDYEALRPWFDREIAGEAGAISPTRPIMYARTSGTTGAPKLIPVTAEVAAGLRRAQWAMTFAQHQATRAFGGRLLAMAGASREVTLPDGTAAGAATGLIYETAPRLLRAKYVVPPKVFEIGDFDLKYQVLARLAVQHGDLSAIATANPSSILRLLEVLREVTPSLIGEIAIGGCAVADRLPADQRTAVLTAIRPSPRRARFLDGLDRQGRPASLAAFWPNLRAVVAWTQGSCGLAASAVAAMLPPGGRMIEAGYVASETRGTVVVDVERGLGFPLIDDVFYEFAPVETWDEGARDTLLLHQLEPGRDYQVLITTAAGLVRYHMNDVVRATEPIRRTPTLAFVRKGLGVTSITGEKLTEDQVSAGMRRLSERLGIGFPFYVLLADDVNAFYVAHLQTEAPDADPVAIASLLDQALCALNIEYASKRHSGRLKPLCANLLRPEAPAAYRRHLVAKGQREAQLKILSLQRSQDCDFEFSPYLLETRNVR